jgi:hypothetical protein
MSSKGKGKSATVGGTPARLASPDRPPSARLLASLAELAANRAAALVQEAALAARAAQERATAAAAAVEREAAEQAEAVAILALILTRDSDETAPGAVSEHTGDDESSYDAPVPKRRRG